MGGISESGKCSRPCLIINDNFTTYTVTSWLIPHRCFLIYSLLYSFMAAHPASPLSLIVKMIFFFLCSHLIKIAASVDLGNLF